MLVAVFKAVKAFTGMSTFNLIFSAVAVAAIFGGAWAILDAFEDRERLQAEVIRLEDNLAEEAQKREIVEAQIELIEQVQQQRQVEMDKLLARLENITVDLGSDSDELAPESLRELLRRLQQ